MRSCYTVLQYRKRCLSIPDTPHLTEFLHLALCFSRLANGINPPSKSIFSPRFSSHILSKSILSSRVPLDFRKAEEIFSMGFENYIRVDSESFL